MTDPILANPYRILGLATDASEKDLKRNISRLKRLADVNQEAALEWDLPALGPLERMPEEVEAAARTLERPEKRFLHALFWFAPFSPVDKLACESLQDGDLQAAGNTWRHAVNGRAISEKLYSSFLNLHVLVLHLSRIEGKIRIREARMAIKLFGALLSSTHLHAHADNVTGKTWKVDYALLTSHAVEAFSNIFKLESSKLTPAGVLKFVELLEPLTDDMRQALRGRLAKPHEAEVRGLLNACEQKREKKSADLRAVGTRLAIRGGKNIEYMNAIYGESSIESVSLADEIADELLNASVAHFNILHEHNLDDAIDGAKELVESAGDFVRGEVVRMKHAEAVKQIALLETQRVTNKLMKQLEVYYERCKEITIDHGQYHTFRSDAWERVSFSSENIKKHTAGASIDSATRREAQGVLVGMVLSQIIDLLNTNTALLSYASDDFKNQFIGMVSTSVSLLGLLKEMEMDPDVRTWYTKNYANLVNIKNEIAVYSSRPTLQRSGCYVATLVYGDVDHEKVRALRRFRDTRLLASPYGRLAVTIYYAISPTLVSYLRPFAGVQKLIRNLLDEFIHRMNA